VRKNVSFNDGTPNEYVFPSYFVFITWGPFASIDDRLELFLTDNTNKTTGEEGKARQRKLSKNENQWILLMIHHPFVGFQ